MLSIETRRYSVVVCAFLEHYPDAEATLNGRLMSRNDAAWCTNSALKHARDLSISVGSLEIMGFHDGPWEMWASSDALELVANLAEKKLLRYRRLQVSDRRGCVELLFSWLGGAIGRLWR